MKPPHAIAIVTNAVSAPASAAVRTGWLTGPELAVDTGPKRLLESRLELVELHVTQHASHHESGEAFPDFAEASSFGDLLRIVPSELRASLRADLVSGFDNLRGPDGVVVRGWGVLLVARRT